MSTLTNKRRNWIDISRGIAILLVVLGHIILLENPDNSHLLNNVQLYIYSFHVPLFFIISGTLMYYSKDRYADYDILDLIKNKAKALLFPYITFSLFAIVVSFVMHHSIFSIAKKLFRVISFVGLNALWFLPCLFLAEVIFFITRKKIKNNLLLIFVIFVFFVLSSSFAYLKNNIFFDSNLMSEVLNLVNVFSKALVACIFMYLGYFIQYFVTEKLQKLNHNSNLLLTFLGCVILFVVHFLLFKLNPDVDLNNSKLGNPILYYIIAFLGSYATILLSMILKDFKLLIFYGQNSLIIMATHLSLPLINAIKFISNSIFNNINIIILNVLIFVGVMFIESLLILLLNKYLKFTFNYKCFKEIILRRKYGTD